MEAVLRRVPDVRRVPVGETAKALEAHLIRELRPRIYLMTPG